MTYKVVVDPFPVFYACNFLRQNQPPAYRIFDSVPSLVCKLLRRLIPGIIYTNRRNIYVTLYLAISTCNYKNVGTKF